MNELGFALFVTAGMALVLLMPLGLLALIGEDDVRTWRKHREALADARLARQRYAKQHGVSGKQWDNWSECGNAECSTL
jgi:hypothetical protein